MAKLPFKTHRVPDEANRDPENFITPRRDESMGAADVIDEALASDGQSVVDEPWIPDDVERPEPQEPPNSPTPPPTTGNPVVDRALNEPLPTYESFTEFSDEEREHQELRLAQTLRAAERKKADIDKLSLEYNDLLVKAGMIKHALQYKEGFVP
jgi:hypothetical protein